MLVGEAVEELEKALRDSVLDQQPRAGETDLAGVVVLPAALRAAATRSQSANTSSGPLPPSSAVKGTRLRAAGSPIARPVSGDPVKEMRCAAGCATSAAPTSSPNPCTTLKTPGGKPASSARSARMEHESGDHSAGFRITVQPAASAGAVFQVESMNGAFQGVITTAGPLGMRSTRLAVPFDDHERPS